MSKSDPKTEYFDHVAVHENILQLHKKLRLMIADKEKFSNERTKLGGLAQDGMKTTYENQLY